MSYGWAKDADTHAQQYGRTKQVRDATGLVVGKVSLTKDAEAIICRTVGWSLRPVVTWNGEYLLEFHLVAEPAGPSPSAVRDVPEEG